MGRHRPDDHATTSRRAVLSAGAGVALGLVGTLPSSSVTAETPVGSRDRADWQVAVVRGTLDSPVGKSDIRASRERVREAVAGRGVDPLRPTPTPGPHAGEIVGHVVTHDERGAMHHYTVAATSERAVERAHRYLDATAAAFRRRRFRSRGVGPRRPGDGPGIRATPVPLERGIGDAWRFYDHGLWDVFDDPYGVISTEYDLAHLCDSGDGRRTDSSDSGQDGGDGREDGYALAAVTAVEPGHSFFGSSYRGWKGRVVHDWGPGEQGVGSPDLTNLGPADHDEGASVTVNVGLVGARFSYGHAPGMAVDQRSSYAADRGEWATRFQPADPCGQREFGSVRPGSAGWLARPPSGSGSRRLLDLEHAHTFRENRCHSLFSSSETRETGWTWHLGTVEY